MRNLLWTICFALGLLTAGWLQPACADDFSDRIAALEKLTETKTAGCGCGCTCGADCRCAQAGPCSASCLCADYAWAKGADGIWRGRSGGIEYRWDEAADKYMRKVGGAWVPWYPPQVTSRRVTVRASGC